MLNAASVFRPGTGALWGVGALEVNGEVAEKGRIIHFMTTDNVRKVDSYVLALDE